VYRWFAWLADRKKEKMAVSRKTVHDPVNERMCWNTESGYSPELEKAMKSGPDFAMAYALISIARSLEDIAVNMEDIAGDVHVLRRYADHELYEP
jgi:hypothetical protein